MKQQDNTQSLDSFVFYRSFYEALQDLEGEDFINLTKSICEYALNQTEPELKGISKTCFSLIKPQLDANYKRRKDGTQGGRPKNANNKPKVLENENHRLSDTKPKVLENENHRLFSEKPNVNVNVNVNDNVNDNVNFNDNVNVNVKSISDEMTEQTEPTNQQKENSSFSNSSIPTLNDIQTFINENHLKVNAEKFFNNYEPYKWKYKNKIIDWKAKILEWNDTEFAKENKNKDEELHFYFDNDKSIEEMTEEEIAENFNFV